MATSPIFIDNFDATRLSGNETGRRIVSEGDKDTSTCGVIVFCERFTCNLYTLYVVTINKLPIVIMLVMLNYHKYRYIVEFPFNSGISVLLFTFTL